LDDSRVEFVAQQTMPQLAPAADGQQHSAFAVSAACGHDPAWQVATVASTGAPTSASIRQLATALRIGDEMNVMKSTTPGGE
jgi:hypothetical protein